MNIKYILNEVAEGNHSAFEKLFSYYSKRIYGVAKKISKSEQIAEEIVQDTFLKVWIKRETLLHIENFEAWLYIIAKNYTLKALQSKYHLQTTSLDEGEEMKEIFSEGKTDWKLRHAEFDQILSKAIQNLPPKQQETYRLIKEMQHSRNEVAEMMGVSPETVKYNLQQAMKSIRANCMVYVEDQKELFIILLFITNF